MRHRDLPRHGGIGCRFGNLGSSGRRPPSLARDSLQAAASSCSETHNREKCQTVFPTRIGEFGRRCALADSAGINLYTAAFQRLFGKDNGLRKVREEPPETVHALAPPSGFRRRSSDTGPQEARAGLDGDTTATDGPRDPSSARASASASNETDRDVVARTAGAGEFDEAARPPAAASGASVNSDSICASPRVRGWAKSPIRRSRRRRRHRRERSRCRSRASRRVPRVSSAASRGSTCGVG